MNINTNQLLQWQYTQNYDENLLFTKSEYENDLHVEYRGNTLDTLALAIYRITVVKSGSMYDSRLNRIIVKYMDSILTYKSNVSPRDIQISIEYLKNVLQSSDSCTIWDLNSGKLIVNSPNVLSTDSHQTVQRVRSHQPLIASDYYAPGYYDKLLDYLKRDSKVTEFESKSYINNELVKCPIGMRRFLPQHDISETSELIHFAGEQCVLATYKFS